MHMTNIIILGLVGGLLPDIIRIIKGKSQTMPGFYKTFWFWFGTILQVGLGGFVVWLMKPESIMQAILIGYAAPGILTSLAAKAENEVGGGPKGDKTKGAIAFNLRTWWR